MWKGTSFVCSRSFFNRECYQLGLDATYDYQLKGGDMR